jgi:hypothetical protein
MKKILLFLIITFIPCVAFADFDIRQGIMKGILEEDQSDFNEEKELLNELSIFQPSFVNRIVTDLNFNDYHRAPYSDTILQLDADARLFSSLNFNKNLALNGFFRMNRVPKIDNQNVGNSFFKNEGIFAEELNLSFKSKNYALVAGKFNLDYGNAWKWGRGIWTQDIAENYRQSEKLGVDGLFRIGDAKKTGLYEFDLAFFTNDRKNLDNSLITSRYSYPKSQKVPGDTRSLQSYVASLDINFDFGERFLDKEKLSYHFAYLDLAMNSNTSVTERIASDQKGFVASINYKYPVIENYSVDTLVEYQRTRNLRGITGLNQNYLTANIINKIYQNWNVTLGYANIDTSKKAAVTGFDRSLREISFGYDFAKTTFFDRLTLQLGYSKQNIDGIGKMNNIGLLMRYYKDF